MTPDEPPPKPVQTQDRTGSRSSSVVKYTTRQGLPELRASCDIEKRDAKEILDRGLAARDGEVETGKWLTDFLFQEFDKVKCSATEIMDNALKSARSGKTADLGCFNEAISGIEVAYREHVVYAHARTEDSSSMIPRNLAVSE